MASKDNLQTGKTVDYKDVTLISALGTAVQGQAQGAAMFYRKYLLHYQLIRETTIAIATVGAALLFSYLILQTQF
jgi:hypothetical protein